MFLSGRGVGVVLHIATAERKVHCAWCTFGSDDVWRSHPAAANTNMLGPIGELSDLLLVDAVAGTDFPCCV